MYDMGAIRQFVVKYSTKLGDFLLFLTAIDTVARKLLASSVTSIKKGKRKKEKCRLDGLIHYPTHKNLSRSNRSLKP